LRLSVWSCSCQRTDGAQEPAATRANVEPAASVNISESSGTMRLSISSHEIQGERLVVTRERKTEQTCLRLPSSLDERLWTSNSSTPARCLPSWLTGIGAYSGESAIAVNIGEHPVQSEVLLAFLNGQAQLPSCSCALSPRAPRRASCKEKTVVTHRSHPVVDRLHARS